MLARAWPELIADPAGERHIVQLYRDPAFLARVASAWGARSLQQGGGALYVCTPENTEAMRAALTDLGIDVGTATAEGRLVFLEAEKLMELFIRDSEPKADLFQRITHGIFATMRKAISPGAEIRAFGEMVNIMWHRGDKGPARRLEALWNEVIDQEDIRLLCAYHVDNLSEETHAKHLKGICEGHSQLIPEEDHEGFDLAVSNALVEVFGESEAGVVRAIFSRKRLVPTAMPTSEAVLFALQEAQPEVGRRVLRAARRHYVGGR